MKELLDILNAGKVPVSDYVITMSDMLPSKEADEALLQILETYENKFVLNE